MTYSALNLPLSYQRVTTELDPSNDEPRGQTSVETATAMRYNADGQLSYSDITASVTVDGAPTSFTHTITQNAYNDLGQIAAFSKTTDQGDPATHAIYQTTTERALADSTYNKQGQLLSSDIQIHDAGVASGLSSQDTARGALDHTYEVITQGLSYNRAGLAAGYQRTTVDGGKSTEESIEGAIHYDSLGRVTQQLSQFEETGSLVGSTLDHIYQVLTMHSNYDDADRAGEIEQVTLRRIEQERCRPLRHRLRRRRPRHRLHSHHD